ncbi:MAG: MmgE/PrpD family protein [Burkholderiales bacterium]
MEVTRTLAKFLVASRSDELPREVVHEASRALLNWLGCAIGASHHETVNNAVAAMRPFFGPAQAQLVGRREKADALRAALINGISSHVLDFDDTHARAVHVSAPVWPALLAFSEWRADQRISGMELIHAFALGVETEVRVGLSVFPEHYDVGYHITGTAGVFGAAAAIGKLLNLNEPQMTWALGIAATQSAGLREMFGSMCKSFHPGSAAHNGFAAALLAQQNFTSAEAGIEGKRGFAHVMSSRFDPNVITGGLGKSYELSRNMYKPFACGLVVHAAIDGCLQLKRELGLRGDEIKRISLRVNPLVLELTGNKKPVDGLQGKFSVFHACAAAIVCGAALEAQFADAVVRDAAVIAVRDKIDATADASIHKLEAHVRMELADGRVLDKHVPRALGSTERPMSDADLEQKFRGLVEGVIPATQAQQLINLCWQFATLPDAAQLPRATASS